MALNFDGDTLPVLFVALLTWGGVFFYLVRLNATARKVEEELKQREYDARREDAFSSTP